MPSEGLAASAESVTVGAPEASCAKAGVCTNAMTTTIKQFIRSKLFMDKSPFYFLTVIESKVFTGKTVKRSFALYCKENCASKVPPESHRHFSHSGHKV